MTYIIDLDAYELHPGDEKVFNNFIRECMGFTSIHVIGFTSNIEYICIIMLMTIDECNFCMLTHCRLYFYH
jgi:hypothetical protein